MQRSIFYSSVPRGTKVHNNRGMVIMLTAHKRWSEKVVEGVVVHGNAEDIGMHQVCWCADVLYSHTDWPCDDDTLVYTHHDSLALKAKRDKRAAELGELDIPH